MRTCRCGIWLKTASCPSRFLMQHGLTSTVGWSIWAKCSEWWQSLSHLTTERHNCYNCGEAVKKSLSQRTYKCSQCGHIQDRDWNAALNILELGLRTQRAHGNVKRLGETSISALVRKLLNVSRVTERGNLRSDSWNPGVRPERMSNKHTANYLVTQYKFLFLPSWETQQMVKNAMVSLRRKQPDRRIQPDRWSL